MAQWVRVLSVQAGRPEFKSPSPWKRQEHSPPLHRADREKLLLEPHWSSCPAKIERSNIFNLIFVSSFMNEDI